MKNNIQETLLEVYPVAPPCGLVGKVDIESEFTLEQTELAFDFMSESILTMRQLCSMVVLNVRQILITACDLMEMVKSIPSLTKRNTAINMSSIMCADITRLASLMDLYDKDQTLVTHSMISNECKAIAAYNC